MSGAHIFANASQGPLQIAWLSWPVGLMFMDSQNGINLHTFKSCFLRIWLPISLSLESDVLPLGTLTGVGTFTTTGTHYKCNRLLGKSQKIER